ncbi:MAG: MATE family efflux transporter [Alphaproteobacteria bacterium]|nr:MAG: MATE family efflux transporter [Alphaproteobacteria bacterium]
MSEPALDAPAPRAPERAALVEGHVAAVLTRLTWPMFGGLLAVISQPLIDTYFLGRLGLQQLAAIQLILPVTFLMLSLTMGLGVATTAVLARHIGAGQWGEGRAIVTYAHLLSASVMLAFSLLGFAFAGPVFRLLGADSALMPLIESYMRVWLAGAFLLALPMTGNACLRAHGEVAASSLVLILIAAGKLAFTPWLVFGGLGMPALGMAGAAWATIGANLIASLLAFYVLGVRNGMFDVSPPSWPVLRRIWARLLSIGAPTALTNMITPLSAMLVNTILLRHGPDALAGFGVGNRIEALSMIVPFSLAISIVPFIGQNQAAGRIDRLHAAMRLALGFNFAFGAVLAIAIAFTATAIGALFSTDAPTIAATRAYLLAIPFSYGFYGALVILGMAFVALGNATPNLMFSSTRLLLVYVPGAYLGNALFGYHGVLGAAALANVAAGALALYWYRRFFPRVPQTAAGVVDGLK